MIPDQWYAILEADALPQDKPVGLVRMGQRLVLWRGPEGQPICFEDRCAHRGVALSIGRVRNGRLACAYHGLEYDDSGRCVHIPCAGEGAKIPASLKTPRYVTREENGMIWLWWGEQRDSYPSIPWIDEVPKNHRLGITRSEPWPFNYVRCVENHLDVHHWAFVHDSIMFAVGESFRDFHLEVEDDGLYIKSYGTLVRTNRHGKQSKRGWDFKAYCRLPGLNMVQVTPRFKSIIFQTPIDDETTWVCVRSFQTYAAFQPFKWMIDRYCIKFLFYVPLHRQDFPIFHEQRPRRSGVGVNKLVAADAGIAKYLTARERLLKEARRRKEERQNGERKPGYDACAPWDAALEATSNGGPPAAGHGSLLPDVARNVLVGNESRWGRVAAWTVACLSFPLLVPSIVSTTLLDWWDGR